MRKVPEERGGNKETHAGLTRTKRRMKSVREIEINREKEIGRRKDMKKPELPEEETKTEN